MRIFKTVAEVQSFVQKTKKSNKTIGFTPTMGALHQGHMSLIHKSNQVADITICCIFVNPTQFNEKSDLDKYPITIEADKKLLAANGTHGLFLPTVDEVYPKGMDTTVTIDLEGMDEVMEGAFRPGHFEGVMQVVNRLLEIVSPDYLMMGQKDFQQFSIIQKMINKRSIDTKLIIVPIKRRKSGLAMSSRNKRLSKKELIIAPIIRKTLLYCRYKLKHGDAIDNVIKYGMKRLTKSGFKPEYLSIVDTKSLNNIKKYDQEVAAVICVATWLGDVRLIDNILV